MKIQVKDLLPNPFRKIDCYPINRKKVEALKVSINETTFWDNLLARRGKHEKFEIAYGHHRLVALEELGIKEVDIPVRELDDTMMIKIMADENLHDWRTNPAVVNETILAAKEFLDSELAECENWNMANKFISRLFKNAKSFSNAKRDGVGQTTIIKFLGKNWKQWMVQEALITFKESDDGKIDRQATESFATQRLAKAFRENVVKCGIPLEEQLGIAEEMIMEGLGYNQIETQMSLYKESQKLSQYADSVIGGEQTYVEDPEGNIIINRKEFLAALDSIKPGLAPNTLCEESEMVIFTPERIFSYNDEIAVSCPFKTGLEGSVWGKELYKILKLLDSDLIKIEKNKDEIVIHSGITKAGFKMIEDMTPPPMGIDEIKSWNRLPEGFTEALNFCIFSAATGVGMGILTCMRVESDIMWSCDNFRASRYKMKSRLAKNVILYIPRSAARPLIDHDPQKVSALDSWIHFKTNEGVTFSCRSMNAEFWPDLERILEEATRGVPRKMSELPKELRKMVARTHILAGDENGRSGIECDVFVDIKLSKNKLICFGKSYLGWVREEIKIKYNGKAFQFRIRPVLLYEMLSKGSEITLLKDCQNRYLLLEGDNYKHLASCFPDAEAQDQTKSVGKKRTRGKKFTRRS